MTVVWPAALPQRLLLDGLSKGLADGRLKTATDTGPGKVRRRSSSAVKPATGVLLVTVDQHARFERFWEEDIGFGSLPFLIPDQFRDGRPMLTSGGEQVLKAEGEPVLIAAWWLVRIDTVTPPTPVSTTHLRIGLQLNIMP